MATSMTSHDYVGQLQNWIKKLLAIVSNNYNESRMVRLVMYEKYDSHLESAFS